MGSKSPRRWRKNAPNSKTVREIKRDAKVATSISNDGKIRRVRFNKSHSALTLGGLSNRMLKTHYPAEFMDSCIVVGYGQHRKVVNFLEEARALKLQVKAADVHASGYMFYALDAKSVRYGLGAVKGVGRGACEAIYEARLNGGESPTCAFCKRVDSSKINRRVLKP